MYRIEIGQHTCGLLRAFNTQVCFLCWSLLLALLCCAGMGWELGVGGLEVVLQALFVQGRCGVGHHNGSVG